MLWKINSGIEYRVPRIAKEILLCLASAFLLILPFPKFNFEFLAWIGFIPLLFVLTNKSKFKAFLLAYFTGVIFWLGIVYWLIHVTLIGMILLVLYLALYFGLFGLIINAMSYERSALGLFFIPSVWVILEYIRSNLFTGFPWALLGYSQYLNLPIIQISDITGAWGVSFLVMMVNIAIHYWATRHTPYATWRNKKLLLPVLCLSIVLIYGYFMIYRDTQYTQRNTIKVSVIQGNIPQELKWDRRAKDFIIDKYFNLTGFAVKDKADLVIWPEASLPVVPEEEPGYFEQVRSFVKESGIPLLFGVVTLGNDHYYNSAVLLSKEGEPLVKYDKLHLVPFGEFIPLRKALPFLEKMVPIGDFKAGEDYTVFSLKPLAISRQPIIFSVLICFEDLFPEISRQFVKKGADFLVNVTNDAWFKNTSSPYQHLQASVFRAVENRVFLARSANTGVSAFIGPTGRIISKVISGGKDTFVDGYKTERISISGRKLSFYTRYGDVFIIFCFVLVALCLFVFAFKKQYL